jgi:signal transduction histidine kinase
MASDSFKTPLAAIRGYSEFITDAPDIKDEYKEYSRRISVSSKHLTFLIEDMLIVLQIEEERIRFENEKILVPDFIKKTTPEFLALIENKNITCTFEQEGLEFAYIMADEIRLKQALMKIVDNAIKYTKEGEVKIKLLNINHQLEIRISDTGIGMDEKECVHLFEKFYRVRNNETQDIKGTGLGLWIAKQFIEKMGGTISIESVKGEGTSVIVKFEGVV